MKHIFTRKYLAVYRREEKDEFVVQNMRKPWDTGHTHIHSYKQAKYLVDCELNKKIPQNVNRYFIISLIRITKDTKYKEQLQRKLDNWNKNDKYVNRPKNFRR